MSSDKVCGCGNPAQFLCDKRVPLSREEALRRFKAGEHVNGVPSTCDAPLCAGCRVQVGATVACFRSGKGKGCELDSVDYCPAHAPRPEFRAVKGDA